MSLQETDGPTRRVRTSSRRWTEADTAELLRLRDEGARTAEIAQALGRSVPAVDNRLGLLRGRGQSATPRARAWSAEDDTALVARLAAGEDPAVVACELGRTPAAARERVRTLARRGDELAAALASRQGRWSEALDARLVTRYLGDATLAEIAAELGLGVSAVDGRVRALRAAGVSLPPRRIPWSAADIARLHRRREQGATLRQIGIELGRSTDSVKRQLRKRHPPGEAS